jgi:hypothetical protein
MRAILPIAVTLLACGGGTEPGPDPSFTLLPTEQWSGGVVTVRSGFFGSTLPVVRAGTEVLTVARIDDTTIAVTLPVGPSGALALSYGGAGRPLGTVQRFGVRSTRLVPGALGFEPLVPEGVSPLVFVAEVLGGGSLAVLDPATHQVTTHTGVGPVQSGFGVLPSYQPNRFVLRDSTGALGVWQLFPAPAFIAPSLVQAMAVRHVSQLRDTLWLTTRGNGYTITTPGGSAESPLTISDPLRIVFSPSGDRVAMTMASAPTGQAPVLEGSTGDTAFAASLLNVQGAAFTGNDRLFLAERGASSAEPDSLVSLVASNGQRLAAVSLPAGYDGWALVADPQADRLYQVADSGGVAAVLVYDPATLQLIGKLTYDNFGSVNYWSAGIGVDVGAGRIHVAYPGSPIPVATFDRLP